MSFTPKLYIGIGDQACFFTLRETYLHTSHFPGAGALGNATLNGVYQGTELTEVRSFHHFNLSQDPDEAFKKASDAAEIMGLELSTSRDSLLDELNKIRRANAEELERRERDHQEREERWAAEREEKLLKQAEMIQDGVMPFGPHEGSEFLDMPRGYLNWIVDNVEKFDEGSLLVQVARVIREKFLELLLPKPDAELLLGEPKKRLTFDVIVIGRRYYDRAAYSGYGVDRVFIVTMIDKDTGACLLSKSTAFCAEEGEELTIKGTVKEHSEYRGQAQTVLQRIAIQS